RQLPDPHAAEAVAFRTVGRRPRGLPEAARRDEMGRDDGMDLRDLADLLHAAAPDLLLGEIAEARGPLVVEMHQVARLLEADREGVGQQVLGGLPGDAELAELR